MLKQIFICCVSVGLLGGCHNSVDHEKFTSSLEDGGSKIYRLSESEVIWVLQLKNTSQEFACLPSRTIEPHIYFTDITVKDGNGKELKYKGSIPLTVVESIGVEMVQPGQTVGAQITLSEDYELTDSFSIEETVRYGDCNQLMKYKSANSVKDIISNYDKIFDKHVVVKSEIH